MDYTVECVRLLHPPCHSSKLYLLRLIGFRKRTQLNWIIWLVAILILQFTVFTVFQKTLKHYPFLMIFSAASKRIFFEVSHLLMKIFWHFTLLSQQHSFRTLNITSKRSKKRAKGERFKKKVSWKWCSEMFSSFYLLRMELKFFN